MLTYKCPSCLADMVAEDDILDIGLGTTGICLMCDECFARVMVDLEVDELGTITTLNEKILYKNYKGRR